MSGPGKALLTVGAVVLTSDLVIATIMTRDAAAVQQQEQRGDAIADHVAAPDSALDTARDPSGKIGQELSDG
jgi:hypothetical protein